MLTLYSISGIVFSAHVFSNLILHVNILALRVVFVGLIFGFMIATSRSKSLSMGNLLKMIIFSLVSVIVLY